MSDTTNDFVTRKEFDDMKKKIEQLEKPKEKRTRAPNQYNLFLGEELKKIKADKPTINNQEAFKLATERWAKHKTSQ